MHKLCQTPTHSRREETPTIIQTPKKRDTHTMLGVSAISCLFPPRKFSFGKPPGLCNVRCINTYIPSSSCFHTKIPAKEKEAYFTICINLHKPFYLNLSRLMFFPTWPKSQPSCTWPNMVNDEAEAKRVC
jgi:hypothetical protein